MAKRTKPEPVTFSPLPETTLENGVAFSGSEPASPVVSIDAQLAELADLMRHLEEAPSHGVAAIARDAQKRILTIRLSQQA